MYKIYEILPRSLQETSWNLSSFRQSRAPAADSPSAGSIFTRPDQYPDDEAFPKTPEPRFTVPLNDVHKKEGEDARFGCRLEPANDETMRVEWLKNGMPLFAGKTFI